MKLKKAFTLVELIVVIAILAILSVTAFVTLTKWFGKSRDSRRVSDLSTIATAINTSFAEPNKIVRLKSDGLTSVKTNDGDEVFNAEFDTNTVQQWKLDSLTKVPKDPTGKSYAVWVYNSWDVAGRFYDLGATLENNRNTGEAGNVAYVYGNYSANSSISGVNYTSLIFSGSYTNDVDTGTFVTPDRKDTWLPYLLE